MDYKALSLVLIALLAATQIDSVQQDEFMSFKSRFGRSYTDVEETYRMAVFNSNIEKINRNNQIFEHKEAVNQFADMTQQEFETIILMAPRVRTEFPRTDLPTTFVGDSDWVAAGAISGVKDQGNCGSCWAFAATAACESAKFMKVGTLGKMSEQQLVSCDVNQGNSGCMGGWEDKAMLYYADNGICTESSYPYTSGGGSVASCRQSSCTMDSFAITGRTWFAGESQLKSMSDQMPLTVAVDASNWSSYSSGIFSNCNKRINHAVLLAGYNSSYWLIKNSWGSFWGESGYIRLAMGDTCAVTQDCAYPHY